MLFSKVNVSGGSDRLRRPPDRYGDGVLDYGIHSDNDGNVKLKILQEAMTTLSSIVSSCK